MSITRHIVDGKVVDEWWIWKDLEVNGLGVTEVLSSSFYARFALAPLTILYNFLIYTLSISV